jgi:hypothetical protein
MSRTRSPTRRFLALRHPDSFLRQGQRTQIGRSTPGEVRVAPSQGLIGANAPDAPYSGPHPRACSPWRRRCRLMLGWGREFSRPLMPVSPALVRNVTRCARRSWGCGWNSHLVHFAKNRGAVPVRAKQNVKNIIIGKWMKGCVV